MLRQSNHFCRPYAHTLVRHAAQCKFTVIHTGSFLRMDKLFQKSLKIIVNHQQIKLGIMGPSREEPSAIQQII